ncbi:MAG: protoporphyrinogen oxidase, partial [Opitutae bacterium]|nr:protoporphyrinogen oxidase [Opitutae bacterium]
TFEHIKLWPKSIPIPDSTMDARIKAASTLGLKNKGLFLKGAHISGAPLPNCLNP